MSTLLRDIFIGLLLTELSLGRLVDQYKREGQTHHVIELTSENFDEKVQNAEKHQWMIFFFAPWCTYCKKFAPHYKYFSEQVQSSIPASVDW